MNENLVPGPMPVVDEGIDRPQDIDADVNGHLALGLFVGVILALLIVIYAFAMAA